MWGADRSNILHLSDCFDIIVESTCRSRLGSLRTC